MDRWLSSRAGLSADVLRGRTSTLVSVICSVIVVLQIQTQIIQLHVSPLLLLICRQFDVSYTSHLLPNIVHTSHFFTISTVLLRDRNRATSLDI